MQVTDQTTSQFGALTITTWTDHQGISIQVYAGPTRQSALSATYPHGQRAGAISWYRTIRDAALARTPIWQIEAQVSCLIDAAQAAGGADAELADAILATLDERRVQDAAKLDAEQAAVADIVNGPRDGWHRARTEARRIRPTRGRVHTLPPTPAQLDRMRAHHNGIVTVDQGQPWKLLDGIVQRGHADPTSIVYWPGTQKIRSVRLNARGWNAIGQQNGVAA
jgi:hypothetical protein